MYSYKILNPKGCEGVTDLIQVAKNLLESTGLDPENYRIGNTKAWAYNIIFLIWLHIPLIFHFFR